MPPIAAETAYADISNILVRICYNIMQVMSVVIEWQSYDPLHGHACMRRLVGKRPPVASSFISFNKLQDLEGRSTLPCFFLFPPAHA